MSELVVKAECEIAISRMPDRARIDDWVNARFTRWTSVCGVGIADIASKAVAERFQGQVFRLSDPFSKSREVGTMSAPSSRMFLESSDALTRAVLLKAVRYVAENYLMAEKQVVFCHLGKSRSPLVAVGALYVVHSWSPTALWAHYVRHFNADPPTELGMSALNWIKDNCKV